MAKTLTQEEQRLYEELLERYKDDEKVLDVVKESMKEGKNPIGLAEILDMFS